MYNTIEDGSSLEILLDDVSPETLFTESLLALSDVLSEATGGTQVTHEVQVAASDLQGLLTAWVEELVRLAESDGFIPERVYKERLESSSFRAMVAGERSIPRAEIRGVTCRAVELKRLDDGAWAARVSLHAGAE